MNAVLSSGGGGGVNGSGVDAHVYGAANTLLLASALCICVGMSYTLRRKKWYKVPESATFMLVSDRPIRSEITRENTNRRSSGR